MSRYNYLLLVVSADICHNRDFLLKQARVGQSMDFPELADAQQVIQLRTIVSYCKLLGLGRQPES